MNIRSDKTRIDKFLWSVRIYKTRSLAAQACELEKVRIGGMPVKPSRAILPGNEVTVRFGPFERVFRVIATIQNRLPAKRVPEFCEEITSSEVIEKMRAHAAARAAWRQPGLGRPTKKERRDMDDFLAFDDW
ncbi:MAG TPA: RNA-binding S4 domain-containing protein [Bacteroidia bacterium]|nr:RNA-binding S4 domain-containing protein [Bacteroidia bacterium]